MEPVSSAGSRGRAWCFTVFLDDVDGEVGGGGELGGDPSSAVERRVSQYGDWLQRSGGYLVYGREKCPTTGRKHLQGFLYSRERVYRTAIQAAFGCQAHLEIKGQHSTYVDCRAYCTKDGDYVEYGVLPSKPGSSGASKGTINWAAVKSSATAGDLDDIDPSVFVRYYSQLCRIRSDYRSKQKPVTLDWAEGDPPNIWYFGAPGVGKSRRARLEYPDAYMKMPQNKWWQGYDDEPHVIIDDLRSDHVFQLSNLITWGDRYPFQAEIKNASTGVIRPTVIVVTSNFEPSDLWSGSDLLSITRRYKVICLDPEMGPSQ